MVPGFVFITFNTMSGVGRHESYLTASQISNVVKWATFSELTYIPSVTFTKISMILFILRIRHSGFVVWISYISLAMTISINVVLEIMMGTQCIPLEGLWDHKVPANCEGAYVLPIIGYIQGGMFNFAELTLNTLLTSQRFLPLSIFLSQYLPLSYCGTSRSK